MIAPAEDATPTVLVPGSGHDPAAAGADDPGQADPGRDDPGRDDPGQSVRQRSNRPAWFLPLVLILVLGTVMSLLVLADTLARGRAEDLLADRVQTELQLTEPPEVDIAGIPFLTQLLGQNLTAVEVTAERAQLQMASSGPGGGSAIELHQVDLQLRDISSSDWFTTAVVGELDGTGQAPWESVQQLIGAEISFSGLDDQGRGRVAVEQTLNLQGLELPITVTGRPEINAASQQLSLAEPELAVSGVTLPADLVADLLTARLKPFDLPLPSGLTVTELSAQPEGLHLTLTGKNVHMG